MGALLSIDVGALPRAERRRRTILDAALRVIAAGGPDAVTHRRVAAEARVPLGSTTYYFATRDDLVREAFLHYLDEATGFLAAIEREHAPVSRAAVVDLLVDVARREFTDTVMVRAEYELVLYAARDETLARAFNRYEHGLETRLAETLERLGAHRPKDAARTLIDVVRGFEIEGLTRPAIELADLERRLFPVVRALTSPSARNGAKRKSGERRSLSRRTGRNTP